MPFPEYKMRGSGSMGTAIPEISRLPNSWSHAKRIILHIELYADSVTRSPCTWFIIEQGVSRTLLSREKQPSKYDIKDIPVEYSTYRIDAGVLGE